ncbi:MAG: DUF6320 domain-containing protein [Clostridia bacterium]|nr:DUF6320 domain-containing protein [Clostridia bacterium]
MRCQKCNVEINCKTLECPLCHERLDTTEDAKKEIQRTERAFPERSKNRPKATTPLNKLYLIISFNIMLISITTNIIVTPKVYWSLIVLGFLLYLYFFLRYTIMSYRHFNSKIFTQAVALIAVFILIQQVMGKNLWIYEYILPAIVFLSMVTIGAYILINIENARKYIFSLFLVAMLGLLPLLIVVFTRQHVVWPAIVVAATSGSIILTAIILAHKILWGEFKRIFHI